MTGVASYPPRVVPPPGGPPGAPAPPPPPPTATRPPASQPARTGVWIAVGTISMTFAALTSAMVVRQGAAPDWRHFQLPPLLYFNTLVLLASSGTLEWSRRRIDSARGPAGVYLTLALGVLFVAGQVVAWRQLAAQGLFLATAPSAAFFYVFTALHGLHVLGGLGGLTYVLHRLRGGGSTPAPRAALGAATLYWHFMDGLWLYLLVILVTRV
ncbi:MAG TPA: cytochrome c oxidase subunit 3 [Gemmatimonadales bacterium]|nr:cytochrome c oxidase subunit 3 [Gemmatimonadales bacterium]